MVDKVSVQDSFRDALQDVIAIADKLAPHCTSIAEMVEMLKLAQDNNSQLNLLMSVIKTK